MTILFGQGLEGIPQGPKPRVFDHLRDPRLKPAGTSHKEEEETFS
jgi:hypothetical protein